MFISVLLESAPVWHQVWSKRLVVCTYAGGCAHPFGIYSLGLGFPSYDFIFMVAASIWEFLRGRKKNDTDLIREYFSLAHERRKSTSDNKFACVYRKSIRSVLKISFLETQQLRWFCHVNLQEGRRNWVNLIYQTCPQNPFFSPQMKHLNSQSFACVFQFGVWVFCLLKNCDHGLALHDYSYPSDLVSFVMIGIGKNTRFLITLWEQGFYSLFAECSW